MRFGCAYCLRFNLSSLALIDAPDRAQAEFGIGRFPINRQEFRLPAIQFFGYYPAVNEMNTQLANFLKSHFINVVAVSLCLPRRSLSESGQSVLASLPPRPRRRSPMAAALLAVTLASVSPGLTIADVININPSKDNTLYEFDATKGDLSNALGMHFFAGETGMGELRRGVLAFDIAGNIPPGSTILGVTLSLNMSRTADNTARTVELHKLLADWGEGTSQASGEEGTGAPATPNDATWRHRFFDTVFWTTEGGDFSATVSASQSVSVLGVYTWSSSQMLADVQSWLDDPATNFGWLVLGDESTIATAKRFDTRESASPPVLTIQFRSAPTPRPRPTPHPRPPR